MRLVAVLLLVANVVVAGYFFLADRDTAQDAGPSRQPLNAERIRVLATGAAALALAPPKPAEDAAKSTLACATLSGVSETQQATAEARLASLDLGARLLRAEPVASSYLVLIPPIPRRPDLTRRVDELIRTGVTDHFVINDGEFRYGISLGFFKSEEAANRHLAYVKGKGVTDAVVRPRISGNRGTTWTLKDLSGAERTEVEAIAREIPGTELRIQPCPAAEAAG